MRKLSFIAFVFALILSSCSNSGQGYLIGVQDRQEWFQPHPPGMVFVGQGSYNMGGTDQDVPYAQTAQTKTVTVNSFYMDDSEITNNEYRQFVNWVRDSIAYYMLGDNIDQETYFTMLDKYGEDLDEPTINWRQKIKWNDLTQEEREALEDMYLPSHERYRRRKEIDVRKLKYKYYWINLREASRKANRPDEGGYASDRSQFIVEEEVHVYPDTLAWIHDFTYAYNEPLARMYFWHPSYDNYPVVGVNWKQANAFCSWRTTLLDDYLGAQGMTYFQPYRLPTESEWEWASRGGNDLNNYPWGGPYTRNSNGCFLANFKPMRGSYADDGGATPLVVGHYAPNDYGLYDMSGNVAEWTSNAFDESAYNFSHDLNLNYEYQAKDDDKAVLKRKVIRGGSWKDVAYYLNVGTRTYEYQDTSKCYIGFRCVQEYLGRMEGDTPNASNLY